ncbi:unnamed protein product [Lupinus luteus]|uniref:Uncharacterized protein n=1 Tax=Lupinus luteus TaxID=3873 RepID=A0AAV1Y3R7_LUPLU
MAIVRLFPRERVNLNHTPQALIISTETFCHHKLLSLCVSKFLLGTPSEKMNAIVEAVLVKQCTTFNIGHKGKSALSPETMLKYMDELPTDGRNQMVDQTGKSMA